MKNLVVFLILCGLFSIAPAPEVRAEEGQPTHIELENVVNEVGARNYTVLENALRVYQAKEAVSVARGNLLPRLNLWRIASLIFDPTNIMGVIEDIAPFLVPANWLRLRQQERLYFAQQEAYRALWANEILTAKSLYYHVLLDQSLLSHIEEHRRCLQRLHVMVASREMFGGARNGSSRDIEVRLLGLQEDKRSLEVLISEELSQLTYAMGYSSAVRLSLQDVQMPDFSRLEPLSYEDFEFRVLDSSPELRQYDHLISASQYMNQEVSFSVLGVSPLSRGVAGGVFDSIPVQPGLGFGLPGSQNIISAQRRIFEIHKHGVDETIQRTLRQLISEYNLDLENYANHGRRVNLTRTSLDQLYEQLNLGENIETDRLVEASRNYIQADAAFFAIQYRTLVHEDKLRRLLFIGSYNRQPAVIETIARNAGARNVQRL